MYKNILVPMALDHGLSPDTLKIATALLAEGGNITALHVYEAPSSSVAAYLDEGILRESYDRARALLAEKVSGHANVTPVLRKGHSSRTIVEYASEVGIDCIVVGSHKPGLGDYLIGSTAARVVRHAQCAVHVLR